MSSRLTRSIALHCSIALAACGGGSGAPCTTDDQCPSHFCKADGTCGAADVDAAPGSDGPIDAPSGLCSPNHDGQISLAELPLVAGRMAKFKTTTTGTFDTAGQANGDGTRHWDLSGVLVGDADASLTLGTPAGAWWQPDFPTATYAAPLAAGSDLLGVFRVDTAAVLLGVVSPAGGTFKTELTYDPPAKILAPPFGSGATWSTTSTVSGMAQGSFVTYDERYTSLVDQVGTMMTPYGEFPVLRVATDLLRTSVGTTLLTKRQFVWVAECFGGVATVVSKDYETAAEFSQTAEIRRLTP